MRVLVVGCGNPLRGDDAAAWHVVRALAARWTEDVEIRLGQQLLPEWAADLAAVDVAFIVDASSSPRTRIAPLRAADALVDGHTYGPEHLLTLTEQVYGTSPVAYVVEVPATDFAFGEDLSPATAAAAGEATRLLECCLTALMPGVDALESGG